MSLRPVVLTAFLAVCCNLAFAQYAGQNINMVSGTKWPTGDPFLQRQNEPSMAVSSRNPEHLMGGANDYRTVDIANPLAPSILGDAWLGVYTSLDGGETWKSTLLPGYPQDTSSVGTSSPLHAYTVATDPTVRAGTNGMFYYSGLVFDRGTSAPSGVFVATFQDQNNKGNGDATMLTKNANGTTHGNPFLYVGANIIDSGTSGQFLDKPWIVVDIPRAGRTATCKVNGVTFSSGYVYLVYTQFNGSQNNPGSKIKEVTSTNCGASWSNPQILSQSQKLAQGTVAAVDPNNGNVYVAWRQIAVAGNQNQPDAMQWAVSTNGGYSFTYEPAAFTFAAPTTKNPYPAGSVFDQPQASPTTFRSLDVPTLAVDGNSRVWMAFSERVNGPAGSGTYGSRIMITTLPKGSMTWTTPMLADSTAGSPQYPYGFQFMPSLNFAYGKMALAWFDSRRDNLENELQCQISSCAGLSDLTSVDIPIPGSSLITSGPSSVFGPLLSDPNNGIRHTIDVYGGIINPSNGPQQFAGFQVSQYGYWVDPGDNQIKQGFFNAPNLPMFVQGTQPFVGDYIDIASQNIIPSGNSWAFNTQATDSTGATNAPDFHFTWTDNRDVVPPPVVNGNEDWTQYVPPNSGTPTKSAYSGTGNACPTCSTTQPACVTVNDDNQSPSAYSGDRNQNVYTSRITNGLVVRFSHENSKPLSKSFNRSFSLLIKNTVPPLKASPLGSPSYYRVLLGTTSTAQSCTNTITNGTAAFPGVQGCYLDVAINPGTTLTQTISLNSSSATAGLNVLVAQIACIPGSNNCANTPSFLGLQALAFINGDPSNPSVADPDFTVADDSNPDVTTPYGNLPIAQGEEYDPTVGGPVAANASNTGVVVDIGSASVTQPAIGGSTSNNAPMVTVNTPRINTPRITSVQVVNPQIVNAINTPRINTPRINTPRIVSPDIFTPRITDLSDSSNPVTDYTWNVNNKGNTTASYKTQELVKAAGVTCCPAGKNGPNCSVCQLMQQKVYESPTPNRESTNGNPSCDLNIQQSYTTIANISDPSFTSGSAGGSPSDPTSSTLSLSPGEGNRVTLRVVAPPQENQKISSFKTQAASFVSDTNGNSAASLAITTGVLPVAVVGQNYTNTTLTSVGGFGATVWTVPGDITNPVAVEPPPAPNSSESLGAAGLTLSPSGQISTNAVSGSPGTYTLNVQVQDSAVSGSAATPSPALDVQQLQLEVNQFTISNVNVAIANEVGSTSYMKAGDTAIISITVNNQGPATATLVAPTVAVTAAASGTPSGPIPVVNCGAPSPVSATLMGSTSQMFNITCTAVSGNGYITFTPSATAQYVNAAATVLAAATSAPLPGLTPSSAPPNIVVDTTLPGLTFLNTTSTPSAPGWYNAPVAVPYTTSDNLSGQFTITPTSPATSTGLSQTGTGTMTLNSEGKSVTGILTLSDYANNSLAFTSPGYNIDETPPTITGAPTPVANGNGWNNTPVTVTFSCNDPNPTNGPAGQQSGLQAGAAGCTQPIVLSAETINQSATGTAKDVATNSAQVTVSGINIDLTAPTVVGTPDRAPNANGWYNAPVTVSFVCADPAPLPPNAGPASGVASCTPPVVLSSDVKGQSIPGAATDKAGNNGATLVSGINIDQIPPSIVANSTYTPSVWTNQTVVVTFTCTDNLSGPALNNPAVVGVPASGFTVTNSPGNPATTTVTLTGETAGTMLTANCQDLAGNNATAVQFGPVMIDKTPPTITATATANGNPYIAGSWTNQPPVVVTFGCTDSLSGVKPGSITASANYGSQGSSSASGSCQDNAGNTSAPYSFAVNIDTTVPGVMIASPSAQNYLLNQKITPSFTCPDNLANGDSVTCTPTPSASPYAATPVGPGTFTVSALDQAGNTANGSVNYLVVYNFTGFQAPLLAATASTAAVQSDSGSFTIGTTIPVAWQLQDANSAYITDPATLTSIVAYPNAACTGPASGTGTTLYNGSTNTSWLNVANNTFTFSWNTTGMTVGCYNLVVTTNDTLQWSSIVHLSQAFAVATPYAIAFDGTNMWVPSYGNSAGTDTVTELNASTGAVVGTYQVGNGADGVLFDGTNIWVANTSDGTVTELSTSGATLGTFPVGNQPWGLASDGTNIWVTNRSGNTVTELAPNGTAVGTYNVGVGPYGIAFDKTNMWVANDNDGTVTKLDPSGAVVGTYSVGGPGSSPVGVAFDGTNIWVAGQPGGVGSVIKLALTGTVLGTYPAGPAPNDILFDKTNNNIWVTNSSSNTVTRLSASTGAIVGTYTVGTGPYGIAFDGTNIWATIPGGNSVTKMPVF